MEDDGRYRVLVVEDDGLLRTTLERGLRRAGYVVDAVSTGSDAVSRARGHEPDAVVLDIGLPDADGRDVCQALRAQGSTAGVIFLTARTHTEDVLSGFAVGGDDYVRKPFAFPELLARVAGVVRRRPISVPAEVTRLVVDPAAHSIRYGADLTRAVDLTPTEFRLVATLIARRPDVIRRSELVAAAWPGSTHVSDNTLDQYITRIRRKLARLRADASVENVRGVGYRLR